MSIVRLNGSKFHKIHLQMLELENIVAPLPFSSDNWEWISWQKCLIPSESESRYGELRLRYSLLIG